METMVKYIGYLLLVIFCLGESVQGFNDEGKCYISQCSAVAWDTCVSDMTLTGQ